MKIGVSMFVTDYSIGPGELAQAAEERGFESLWMPEHTHIPVSRKSPWGGGPVLPDYYKETLDPFMALTAAAVATKRLKLATGICLVVERDPIHTAKQVATLDVLSAGRVLFGIGGGWNAEEMANHGTVFETRFALMRERIEAMKAIWANDVAEYRGAHVAIEPMWCRPKPVQKPHPPIWIGGESKAAIRRTIQFADVWYPGNNSQTRPLDTPQRLGESIAHVKQACKTAGRDPASLGVGLLVQNYFEWGDHEVNDGSARRMFTGTSEQMAADARALEKIGVGHVTLRLGGNSAAEAVERIERFAKEVIGAI